MGNFSSSLTAWIIGSGYKNEKGVAPDPKGRDVCCRATGHSVVAVVGHYGFDHNFDRDDVAEEAQQNLQVLRRRANGILLNFISASEMNFTSKYFQFPNGA